MFSVECEKCKNAIPLGMMECPICSAKEAAGDTQTGMAPPVPAAVPHPAGPMPVPVASAPIASAPTAPPAPRQQTYTVPQQQAALPPWLVAVGVAVALGLILAVGYLVLLPKLRNGGRTAAAASSPTATLETPAPKTAAVAPAVTGSRFGKYIEIVGIRVIEENKKATVKFLVINHAAAELSDINGTVEIHPTNAQTMVGRVDVKILSLAPYESREFSASLNTTLRAYEIPDWQFLRGQFVE
ncbi:MAG: hypothetical protein ABI972_04950 [Acidobacteriota bacterium]